MFINPGGGPVNGDVSFENASENIKAFIADCEIPLIVVSSDHVSYNGRYTFVLRNDKYDYETVIEMPGLPLEKVRYVKGDSRNIFYFPRLYVDGSSWIWYLATITKAEIKEMLENRISDMEKKIKEMKDLLAELGE